jgi:serine/threonine protein kinase
MAECEHCGATMPADAEKCPSCGEERAPDELLGTEILGRYKLIKLIAEGGMGRVYLAEQAVGTVQRRVAVKVLRKALGRDKQLMSRFAREAETLVRLTHPNTVQLFDFGSLPDGTLALAMEYVKGHSLAFELHKGPLSVPRAERMLTQICGALEEAHANGIVHRDLKPDNLLIADRTGQGDFVKVLDFGIAKVTEDGERKNTKLTQQGMIIGTPPYMSPEQFSGEAIDARSDIYSLGVISYEMLTGRLPFVANTPWEWASKHLTATPESLRPDTQRGLSFAHARALDAALQKNPADRPQTVQAFLDMFTTREGAGALTMPLARTEVGLHASASTPPPQDSVEAQHPSTDTTRTGSLLQKRSLGLAGFVLAGLAAVALGLVAYLAVPWSPAQPVLAPAALPSHEVASAPGGANAEPSAPTALPLGVAPPEAAHDEPRQRRHRSERDQARGAEPARAASEVSSAPEPVRGADVARTGPEPVRGADPVHSGSELLRAASSSEGPQAVQKASASKPPSDLEMRVAQIVANTSARPEVALGLYQAATGRYGAHPSLSSLRPQLTGAVEARVRQLIKDGRCAQAQAMQRALRGAFGGLPAAGLFGPSCPSP